jgi:hypothetical protein
MKRLLLCGVASIALSLIAGESASAGFPVWNHQGWAANRGQCLPWHNAYYHAAYGEPIGLVVPPTAEYQTQYGWGVGGTRVTPIYHQFGRPYPGANAGAYGYFYPTPAWPSDTNQFGVHYIRGPW